jgi:ribonuclease Z
MRPLLHPSLVNGRWGDPALWIETLYERRALLFDLGDIGVLPARKIHRLDQIFVSHAHIDHFVGCDRLLRILVGREKTISLHGPAGFIDNVHHKLHAYRWNLVASYDCDLTIRVTEIVAATEARSSLFRLKTAFTEEPVGTHQLHGGIVHSEPGYHVSVAVLDHDTPCLGFAVKEAAHANVWKNRLAQLEVPVGPWLRELKRAVIDNRPDDYPILIGGQSAIPEKRELPLGRLREAVTITPGQKIAYIADAADTPRNRSAIIELVRDADLLFIEAAFAQADSALARERAHLTTQAAGEIAREARVRRVEPFHFSPRYAGEEERLLKEVRAAFEGC